MVTNGEQRGPNATEREPQQKQDPCERQWDDYQAAWALA